MVKKCLRCNGDNDDNAIFCSSCGTRLSGARPGVFVAKPGQGDLTARASIGFVMTIIGGFLIILGSLILPWVLSFLAIGLPWAPLSCLVGLLWE